MPEESPREVSLTQLNAILARANGFSVASEDSPAERRDRAAADDADLDVKLKKLLAIIALVLLVGQIAVADWVFYLYAAQNDFQIETAAISAWLGATVIEVIGIVSIIASYLFPRPSTKTKD